MANGSSSRSKGRSTSRSSSSRSSSGSGTRKSSGGTRAPRSSSRPRSSRRKKSERRVGPFSEFQFYALIYIIGILLLNLFIWRSPKFCDWFSQYVFPIFLNTYGRITGLFPFSVGEVLIVIGIILCVIAALLWIPLLILRKKHKGGGICSKICLYYKAFAVILINLFLVMTINCFVLYHCTPLDPNPKAEKREYTSEELLTLRNHLVNEANKLADQMERDDNGWVVYNKDMQKECRKAMKKLGKSYPKLDGWYTKVKTLHFSDLVSQMYVGGYFFPFSMEANANSNMYIANYPDVYCHELAHTRGYIYENEANFLSFLACIGSDDPFLQYSGYLSVLTYVESDCISSLNDEELAQAIGWDERIATVDIAFLTPGTWERIEEEAILDTEIVDQISDVVTDTSLKVNGVESGIVSYSEVVGLLLQYYDGILY